MNLQQKILCALMKLGVNHQSHSQYRLSELITDFVGKDEPQTEVGDTEDGRFREYTTGQLSEIVATSHPQNIHLKIGNLEVISPREPIEGTSRGPTLFHDSRIILDGKPFGARKLDVRGDINGVWNVELGFMPARTLRKVGEK